MKIDNEFKNLIPELAADEYRELERSILAEGCRDALVVWEDTLIDGHNRYEICTKHGLPFDTVERVFSCRENVTEWIIRNQFARRNLPAYERARLALRLKPVIAERAKENLAIGAEITNTGLQKSVKAVNTQKEIAKAAGVSHDTIAKVERIEQAAPEDVKVKLRNQEISINQAYQEIKKAERKADIQKQIDDIEQGKAVLPDGKFEAIVIDPPWAYGTEYSASGRRVANPYPEMTQAELLKIEIPSADNAVLFLWTTHRFIWDARELLEAWGFTYRNLIVWDKEKIGMGDLFRMQCEFCLVGIKGAPVLKNNHAQRDIISEPRREHSRKPDAFYAMVDELCVGRKLDYFSREGREGWEVFGNDSAKF